MTSVVAALMSRPLTLMTPVVFTLSIRSFIRLRQRRRVDLPQPEGPMKAVTRRSSMSIEMSCRTWFSPEAGVRQGLGVVRHGLPLEGSRLVLGAEAVADDDGGQVEQHHDDEEEDRG